MGPMQAILSSVMTIFFYALVIAAVWKIFQAAAELSEIKKLLTDIRQNTANPATRPVPVPEGVAVKSAAQPVAPAPISLEAAEELLREVAAESEALEKTQVSG